MTRPTQSIGHRLAAAELALTNAQNDEVILSALAPFSYDNERIQEGRDLYESARNMVNQQAAVYGQQYEYTGDLGTAWAAADAVYMPALKVARIALRDHERANEALKLSGIRKKSLWGWLEQAQVFYANLLADEEMLAAMARFGYDRAKLENEAAMVKSVAAADHTQEGQKGEAQQATKMRDANLDEMDQWLSDFKVIARIALTEAPQMLEKLGFGAVA